MLQLCTSTASLAHRLNFQHPTSHCYASTKNLGRRERGTAGKTSKTRQAAQAGPTTLCTALVRDSPASCPIYTLTFAHFSLLSHIFPLSKLFVADIFIQDISFGARCQLKTRPAQLLKSSHKASPAWRQPIRLLSSSSKAPLKLRMIPTTQSRPQKLRQRQSSRPRRLVFRPSLSIPMRPPRPKLLKLNRYVGLYNPHPIPAADHVLFCSEFLTAFTTNLNQRVLRL